MYTEKMKSILFIINGRSLGNYTHTNFESNPGIGGTEFVTLQLAHLLEASNPNLTIKIHYHESQNTADDISIANCRKYPTTPDFDLIICPVASASTIKKSDFSAERIIFVSHHPHDFHHLPQLSREQKIDFVSLGSYQYSSNLKRFGPHYQIPNLMPHVKQHLKQSSFQGNFVFLGALNKAKGFLQVLDLFKDLALSMPTNHFKLNVIGGDIYNEGNSSYDRLILKRYNSLPASIQAKIVFHGMVTADVKNKILSGSDIALLNPTGFTEAYPASVFEAYSYSLPVFGGFDYGMQDAMLPDARFDLRNSDVIATYIQNIQKMPEIYLSDQKSCFNKWSSAQRGNHETLSKWLALIQGTLNKEALTPTTRTIEFRTKISATKSLIKRVFRND